MFEMFFVRIMEWAVTGKPIQASLAEITSISRKTWDAGGPKRPAAKARAALEIRDYGNRKSQGEIETLLERLPETTEEAPYYLSTLIRMCSTSKEFPAETLALAMRMDEMAHELWCAKLRGDFVACKQALLNTPLLERHYFADTERELSVEGIPLALRKARMASDWNGLDIAIKAITANSLFSLLACWDIEFCRSYFPGQTPFPIFESVMLHATHELQENPKLGRDTFHRPTRNLLDLLAILGDWIRNHEVKPPQKVTVQKMATWLEFGDPQIPAQKLWNWRSGRDAFLLEDLDVVWRRLTGAYDNEGKYQAMPPPPIPIFVATQIWQNVLLQGDNKKGTRSFLFIEPWYLWWWEHHCARLRAKGITWGDRPWPACIRRQSSWSGAKSPDSNRPSQSSGRSSKSRDSQ